jgi:hypothetical protein
MALSKMNMELLSAAFLDPWHVASLPQSNMDFLVLDMAKGRHPHSPQR